jgi:hypothetical protein
MMLVTHKHLRLNNPQEGLEATHMYLKHLETKRDQAVKPYTPVTTPPPTPTTYGVISTPPLPAPDQERTN